MNYIDMHCDTLAKAAAQQKKTAGELRNTMVDAKRLHQGGAKAQFFAMFLQQKREENWSDPGLAYTEKNNLWYTDAEIRKQMQDMYEVYQLSLIHIYPDDSDDKGRILRVYQQYFMVSNAARLIIDETLARGGDLHKLNEYAVIQINDTHPSLSLIHI